MILKSTPVKYFFKISDTSNFNFSDWASGQNKVKLYMYLNALFDDESTVERKINKNLLICLWTENEQKPLFLKKLIRKIEFIMKVEIIRADTRSPKK